MMNITFNDVLVEAKKTGSLKQSYLMHIGATDIDDISYHENIKPLNIDAMSSIVNDNNVSYTKQKKWVDNIMSNVSRSPFSKVRTAYYSIGQNAQIYTKGSDKKIPYEEYEDDLKHRVTEPNTIYIRKSVHRDDIIDIQGLDTIKWLKHEMQVKLYKTLAEAILFNASNEVRCIAYDKFAIRVLEKGDISDTSKVATMIDSLIANSNMNILENYEFLEDATLYASPKLVKTALSLKDSAGQKIYPNIKALSDAFLVKEIIIVPNMDEVTADIESRNGQLLGIIANLQNYTLGGIDNNIGFFEDFDLDFNSKELLLETRCSGALTVPNSAIVLGTC